VVDRTDVVRVFVDIPEQDANYVKVGTKASVLVRAFRDQPIPATVTRTSWALNVKSRTLRAEIDLYNSEVPKNYTDPGSHPIATAGPSQTGSQLLPGMYAYGKVIIEHPGAHALPVAARMHIDDNTFCDVAGCKREHARMSALMSVGEKTYCWRYENGRAQQLEVETGLSDGGWIEVTNYQVPPPPGSPDHWVPVTGTEPFILGDLSLLADGAPVEVAPTAQATKVAGHAPDQRPTNPPFEARQRRVGPSWQAGTAREVASSHGVAATPH
jgi:hypothetical protein